MTFRMPHPLSKSFLEVHKENVKKDSTDVLSQITKGWTQFDDGSKGSNSGT